MSQYFSALFRRRLNDGWFRAGRFDVTTVDIITALALVSMFVWALSRTFWSNLVFFAPAVRNGEVWRLVTWPIAEQPDIFALLSLAFFWSFGQQLEGLFGRNKFLGWVLAVVTIPSISLTLLGMVNSNFDFTSANLGVGPLFLAGIWVYAATYPNVRWFDVVPIWALAGVFTLLQLLQFTGNRASGGILFLLITIAAALSVGRSLGFATGWPIPHVPMNIGMSARTRRASKPARRSKPTKPKRSKRDTSGPRVVEGPWQDSTGSSIPAPPSSSAAAGDQAELDSLLDKISSDGMDSLSNGDKQRLNELSKRLRNR